MVTLRADGSGDFSLNRKEIERLLKDVYSGKDPNKKQLFEAVHKHLSNGIYKGYKKDFTGVKYNSPDFVMLNELTYNVGVFAAFKNHSHVNELVSLLKKEGGSLRTFKEFKEKATKVIGKYNERYLKVEYNHAITSARAARKWQDVQRTKHLYPNLIYVALMDDRTRPLHKQYHGIILPVDHVFWRTHFPPLDWECRCTARRTKKEVDTKGYDVENMPELPKQFANNPGIDGKVFSDAHPYFDTKDYKKVAAFANAALVSYGRKQIKEHLKKVGFPKRGFTSEIGKITITNKALNHLVSTYHESAYMRNNLLYDLKGVIKDAKYVKSAKETKDNPMIKKYHYLSVTVGKKSFYLNVRELVNGDLVLHAISGKIK